MYGEETLEENKAKFKDEITEFEQKMDKLKVELDQLKVEEADLFTIANRRSSLQTYENCKRKPKKKKIL